MSFPTRRTFLQTAVAAAASLLLPRGVRAEKSSGSFWFLHAPTGQAWPTADPVTWALANAHQPILERASAGLLKLTSADGQRITRLVTRRCRLNLIELRPQRVVVHFWGQQGRADLRPFFKAHGLARKVVQVALLDRKREVITLQAGDHFLFGQRLPQDFPVDLYRHKWQRRGQEEPDDRTAAPSSWSSLVWEGIEPSRIPWAVLKGAWRTADSPRCMNCNSPTILTGCGRNQCGMFNWRHVLHHACLGCGRQFEENLPADLGRWLVAHLDRPLLPGFQVIWGKPNKLQPPEPGGPVAGPDAPA
jgi:hypothetical protein